jgi:butyryl-CoA dehydrogenase
MQAFGHLVIAWTWLDVLLAVPGDSTRPEHEGRRRARYFFHTSCRRSMPGCGLSRRATRPAPTMPEEAF